MFASSEGTCETAQFLKLVETKTENIRELRSWFGRVSTRDQNFQGLRNAVSLSKTLYTHTVQGVLQNCGHGSNTSYKNKLTHISLASILSDIGKQCRFRSDAASDQVLHRLLTECKF